MISKEIAEYATGLTLQCFNAKCNDFVCLLEQERDDGSHRSVDNPFYRWALCGRRPSSLSVRHRRSYIYYRNSRSYGQKKRDYELKHWCSLCMHQTVWCKCGLMGFCWSDKTCDLCGEEVALCVQDMDTFTDRCKARKKPGVCQECDALYCKKCCAFYGPTDISWGWRHGLCVQCQDKPGLRGKMRTGCSQHRSFERFKERMDR